MMLIDFENHFYDISIIEALEKRDIPPFYRNKTNTITWTDTVHMNVEKLLPLLLDVGEERIEFLDRLGIDLAIISCSPGPEQLPANESIEVCKKTNDALYELTKRYPRRYLGSAILPVYDVDEACYELERCVKELGFIAWHTHSNYGETALDNECYFPILKKAAELGVYVYLHPQLPDTPRLSDFGFSFAGPGLGFNVDTMISTMRLIISGIFDELPELTVVLGHLGEALPFLLERIDNRMKFIPNELLKNQHDPSYYFKQNILVTTSGNMSEAAFNCTKEVLGIDRILFGSDHPYEDASEMVSFFKNLPLSKREREQVSWKNGIEKLGINIGTSI